MFGKRDRYTGGTCARTCTLICTRVRAHVPYALRSCSVKRELEERPDRINSDIASNTSVQCELCGVPCHVLCDRVRFGVRFGSASCSASSRTQTQPVLEARVRVMIARQLTLAGNTAYPVRCRGSAQLCLRQSSRSTAAGRGRMPGARVFTRVRFCRLPRRILFLCAARLPRPLHCARAEPQWQWQALERAFYTFDWQRALCALLILSAHTAQRQLVRGLQLAPFLPTAQMAVCEVLTDTNGVEFAQIRSSLCTSVRNIGNLNLNWWKCLN